MATLIVATIGRDDRPPLLRPRRDVIARLVGSMGAWLGVAGLLASVLAGTGCGPSDPPTRAGAAPTRPPNVVIVIADDQSWRDYGFMGSPVARTPALDRLAESGTVFTHAFTTASACRPSLRSLLTGLEPQRLDALRDRLHERRVPFPELAAMRRVDTLPRLLGEHGYVSFQGGKHWEGRYQLTGFSEGTALGFDAARGGRDGLLREMSGGEGNELGRTTMAPLLDFVSAHRAEPFLLWFAPMLPHTPHDPPPEYLARYEEGPAAALSAAERRYLGNVSRLDDRVGELLDHLAFLGLREHTLVVFVADNGWDHTGEGGPVHPHLGGPRGKFSVYENGFRTPMILSWPGVVPAGLRSDALVSTLDVLPTVLDYTGVADPPGDRSGVSLRALVEGSAAPPREQLIGAMVRLREPTGEGAPESLLPVRSEQGFFLRAPGWHYVWMPERGVESLYAIDDDPWQLDDRAFEHPDRAAAYRAAVEAWRTRMREPARTRPTHAPARDHSPSSM